MLANEIEAELSYYGGACGDAFLDYYACYADALGDCDFTCAEEMACEQVLYDAMRSHDCDF